MWHWRIKLNVISGIVTINETELMGHTTEDSEAFSDKDQYEQHGPITAISVSGTYTIDSIQARYLNELLIF